MKTQNHFTEMQNKANLQQDFPLTIKQSSDAKWKEKNRTNIDSFNEFEQQAGLFTDDNEYGVI
ncbi:MULTISPECIES: type II toxin-antitoxin system CcdA family antitoxin [Providencia]|uniref:Post-segregation antitoxin (Ccd killing mechanism protein) encoded by the F plasmid n=3 Tax=Providencia TaxID=586 RepID=A0A264VNA3_PRORE|nr:MULTISPECIES: type II toxin-antitoxin system CcdA family antitoxin [Providencia]EHZ6872142.1 type II toxin-antitoxin system CcdA family antitoxin [Providencia rettgeri]MBG5928387.1 type II toxin-antitoxin system CcdA family antitoxin [Providencia rettgeri]MBJ9970982.1 type II toxin-antitoxin system CcdA family antitoxin [Providencia rettgeri]MBN6364792.1 type II toxin-antitoxin system CcdA family antitoxin [Providencia rettgeri]MBN7841404.1 type II toxin-antitoxin system CcdA family antitox